MNDGILLSEPPRILDQINHFGVESDGDRKPSGRLSPKLIWPLKAVSTTLDYVALLILVALVAAVPVLQFASLGYLLVAAARMADRMPWRLCLPGLRRAGKLGRFLLLAGLLYLPVLLVVDLSFSAELMQPGSNSAKLWRISAVVISCLWLIHIAWAAYRGGYWWQLLWPSPIRFLREFWRLSTWSEAGERLTELVFSMRIPRLWWLGARATIAALLWLVIPVSLMIIGQRAEQLEIAPLLGLLGAVGLSWLLFYLPFLQIEFSRTGAMKSFIQLATIRQMYAMAPIAWGLALAVLCILAIPLYILRIEATPADLVWLPSVVFVSLMLPAKMILGWAMGRSKLRRDRMLPRRAWVLRWIGRTLGLAGVLIYVGALYLAQLVAGQGVLVMYFQHIFLAPNPLFST